jgi:putative oxidoreductase
MMSYELAFLILRLVVGGLMYGHGTQKLFGWYGGHGFAGVRAWLAGLRLRPATFWTAMAGLSELSGGLLLAAGFLSPLGSLGIIAAMLMAIILTHWPRLWNTDNGLEYPLVLLTAAAVVGAAGPGPYSLDALLGTGLPSPEAFVVGLGLVLAGVALAFATRARPAVEAEASVDTLPKAA